MYRLSQTTCKALSAKLGKLLSASGKSRKPLSMQSHRPIPIATFTPKFDAEFNRGKRVDPDSERNEAAKLKAQYKKERKGAIRELRKDARFIAGERVKEQKQKDQEYEKRMRSVVGSIATTERAEEKAADRYVILVGGFDSLLTACFTGRRLATSEELGESDVSICVFHCLCHDQYPFAHSLLRYHEASIHQYKLQHNNCPDKLDSDSRRPSSSGFSRSL